MRLVLQSTPHVCLVLCHLCCMLASVVASDGNMKLARKLAKPWYMRKIEISPELTLPISPISIAVLSLSIFYLFYFWSGKPVYVVASHILLEHKDAEAESKLTTWKEKIGRDANMFAKYARTHSACPSKAQGGSLGRFKRYSMVPQFDSICFDPKTPLQTAIGPILTPFGWHLIYIHERQLEEK